MIDGTALGELTEGDIKSLVKPLGQVKRIVRAINSLKATSKEKVRKKSAMIVVNLLGVLFIMCTGYVH